MVAFGQPDAVFETVMMKRIAAFPAVLLLVLVTACNAVKHESVPEALLGSVTVEGVGNLRNWADEFSGNGEALTQTYAEALRAHLDANGRQFDILTLSGGGQSGAYGAGLLNGWTASGQRPEFEIVTGVSTGAIIAPFAFLGSRYDPVLKEIYTTTRTRDIGRVNLASGGGLMNVSGFENLLKKHVTPQLLNAIAAESRAGRMLLVGTTNLEAERGVIWNLSGLSASTYPGKVELFRKIIQASASIPGAFPPVAIPVDYNGQHFEELHVDGGVTEQVFLYPPNITIRNLEKALGFSLKKRVFVVRNTKLDASYKPLEKGTVQIVERSLNTLIRNQGRSDVGRIYDIAERDGIAFYRTSIPNSFEHKSKGFFDPEYMKPLFELGYQAGADPDGWERSRP